MDKTTRRHPIFILLCGLRKAMVIPAIKSMPRTPIRGRIPGKGRPGAPVPHGVAMGSSATTYGPCSITICKRAGQITLKSEQLQDGRLPFVDRGSVILSK